MHKDPGARTAGAFDMAAPVLLPHPVLSQDGWAVQMAPLSTSHLATDRTGNASAKTYKQKPTESDSVTLRCNSHWLLSSQVADEAAVHWLHCCTLTQSLHVIKFKVVMLQMLCIVTCC